MVDELLLKLIGKVELVRGGLNLFMLWRTALNGENWNVIISSKWCDLMSEKEALTFWIGQFKENLPNDYLSKMLRVNVLATSNPFVTEINHKYPFMNKTIYIENQTIKDVYIKEAYIVRSTISPNQLEVGNANINPRFNANLNPRFNANINPRFNANLNPRFNANINPRFNANLNPRFNANINPRFNANLNPRFNANINPRFNANLNPRFNANINPRFNANLNPRFNANINPRNSAFQGMYSYDLDLNKNGYFISASDQVILYYSISNDFELVGVKTDAGYALFDLDNNFVGYLVNSDHVMLRFSTENDWIGLVVK